MPNPDLRTHGRQAQDCEVRGHSILRSLTLRDFLGPLGAVGLAWLLMFGSGRLQHGWHPGEIGAYALTEGLQSMIGPLQLLLGAVGLLALVPFRWASFAIGALLLPAPFMVAIARESAGVPSSHNLLPFEVAGLYVQFLPLLGLPSLVKVFVTGPPGRRRARFRPAYIRRPHGQ